MIFKILGCICILTGTCAYGYCTGLDYKRHIGQLEYIDRLIWQIKGEISYTKAPLNEVFKRISRRVDDPYKSWLETLAKEMEKNQGRSFDELFREITRSNLKELLLDEEEKSQLENLGSQMSFMDIRMQEQALVWYAKQLEERRDRLLEGLSQRQRLANCLGAAAGIFLVILVI